MVAWTRRCTSLLGTMLRRAWIASFWSTFATRSFWAMMSTSMKSETRTSDVPSGCSSPSSLAGCSSSGACGMPGGNQEGS